MRLEPREVVWLLRRIAANIDPRQGYTTRAADSAPCAAEVTLESRTKYEAAVGCPQCPLCCKMLSISGARIKTYVDLRLGLIGS